MNSGKKKSKKKPTVEQLQKENEDLRRSLSDLYEIACPGCGKYIPGAHLCPGPEQGPLVFKANDVVDFSGLIPYHRIKDNSSWLGLASLDAFGPESTATKGKVTTAYWKVGV